MRYQLAPISTRPWLLNGLSLRLIESHYEDHYGGALRRLNAIVEQLETLDFDKTGFGVDPVSWTLQIARKCGRSGPWPSANGGRSRRSSRLRRCG